VFKGLNKVRHFVWSSQLLSDIMATHGKWWRLPDSCQATYT